MLCRTFNGCLTKQIAVSFCGLGTSFPRPSDLISNMHPGRRDGSLTPVVQDIKGPLAIIRYDPCTESLKSDDEENA